MSAGVQTRSAMRGARPQSLFYRDLSASPATRALGERGSDLNPPSQAAAAAALWRENSIGGGADPPPPPFYTLEDRIERSPESNTDLPFRILEPKFSDHKSLSGKTAHSPPLGQGGYGLPYGEHSALQPSPTTPQTQISNWWSPLRDRGMEHSAGRETADREGSSPVSGVVQQQMSGGLLALSAPREIVRPGFQRSSTAIKGRDGEEWVTVFGFGVEETNAVMREFEKCGPIVNHISGPGGANWVHIQYQNYYDAQKALQKNGIQLNGALIVGVKSLDAQQRQALTEKVNKGVSFMGLSHRTPSRGTSTVVQPSTWAYHQQTVETGAPPRSISAIASPAKSTISKLVDIVFGI